jgi:hypothetical protein
MQTFHIKKSDILQFLISIIFTGHLVHYYKNAHIQISCERIKLFKINVVYPSCNLAASPIVPGYLKPPIHMQIKVNTVFILDYNVLLIKNSSSQMSTFYLYQQSLQKQKQKNSVALNLLANYTDHSGSTALTTWYPSIPKVGSHYNMCKNYRQTFTM